MVRTIARQLILAALFGSTCSVSSPADPSFPTQAPALVIHYPANGTRMMTGGLANFTQFEAYTIDTDGVYVNVTTRAAWASSDAQVLSQVNPTGVFMLARGGSAAVSAAYQGVQATLPVVVRDPPAFPYLQISLNPPGQAPSVSIRLGPVGTQPLTIGEVSWTTSDEQIATLDSLKRATPHAPGNVTITATVDGLSDWYWISAPPRSR